MIDTLWMRLEDVKIMPGAKIEFEGGKTNFETGEVKQVLLFEDVTGKQAFGKTAYCNAETYCLDIKPLYGGIGFILRLSVPKQIHENNYSPILEGEFSQVLQKVEQGLSDNGIKTRLEKAKVTRLDCFKNTLPSEPIPCYSRVFSLLNANYAKDKTTYGVDGWLMKNSRQQFCIYNKLEEMKKNKEVTKGLPETLRFEHRVLKADKVQSFYNFTTIEELKAKGWQALIDKQKETWRDDFFKYSPEEIEIRAESQLRTEMEYFQAKYGNRFFSKYLKVIGAQALMQQAGGFEVVKKALENMACNRMRVWRAEKELTEALFEIENLKVEPITLKTLGSLYIELKEKVLA